MHDLSDEELAAFNERVRQARENEPDRGSSLARKAARFLLIAGGATVAGAVIIPGTTAGASRTARLEWQSREAEIAKAIETPPPSAPSEKP